MDKYYLYTGLAIAMGLSTFLVVVRNKKWCTNFFRFGLTGLLFVIGMIGLLFVEVPTKNQRLFFIWIQIPLLITLIDKLFKMLSFKIQNRDFILYMRGSEDLDINNKNPNLKTSDYVLSIILIILLFTIPLIGFI